LGRKIVVFSDGTGNSAASTTKTNVWRVYEALDLTGDDQIAIFDDGVGTSAFNPARYLGLAFGYGLKTNVLDLYKFICRNYQDGDEIHCFGFSRGAFTIRLLIGLITSVGLVPQVTAEEMHRRARAAYRTYRRDAFRRPWLTTLFRRIRDWCSPPAKGDYRTEGIRIRFLGLWDTVGAYGMPIDELTIAVDRWVWPMVLMDHSLPANVERARHALALDDERRTFHAITLVDPGPSAAKIAEGACLDDQRLIEAWFAGMHANVGGGYADDRLAHVSLCWILHEAAQVGLRFRGDKLAEYEAYASANGEMADSRSGAGIFYRYHPRSVHKTVFGADNERLGQAPTPLLHHSVVRRMAEGADRYAPISIDTDINVLGEANNVVAFRHPPAGLKTAGPTEQALARLLLRPGSDAQQNRLRAARDEAMARAQDLVCWRRLDYLAMVVLATAFVAVAAFAPAPECPSINGVFADVIKLPLAVVGLVLPGPAAFLLTPFQERPLLAVPMLAAFLAILWISGVLQTRIRDWAAAGWRDTWRQPAIEIDHTEKSAQIRMLRRWALALVAFAAMLAVVAAWNWPVGWWDVGTIGTALAGALGLAWIRAAAQRRFRTVPRDRPADWRLLDFARSCRNSPCLVRVYRWLARVVAPLAFLLVTGWAVLFLLVGPLVAQAIFQTRVLLGAVCRESDLTPTGDRFFLVNDRCWASGLTVTEGQRYRLRMQIMPSPAQQPPDPEGWFDRTTPADLRGLAWEGMAHRAGFLLKRWSGENWFTPVVRIGRTGMTEFPLRVEGATAPAWPPGIRPWIAAIADAAERADLAIDKSIPNDIANRIVMEMNKAGRTVTVLETVFRAPKTGEIFLYVNDAVPYLKYWQFPPLATMDFYANNSGAAKVTLERLD